MTACPEAPWADWEPAFGESHRRTRLFIVAGDSSLNFLAQSSGVNSLYLLFLSDSVSTQDTTLRCSQYCFIVTIIMIVNKFNFIVIIKFSTPEN